MIPQTPPPAGSQDLREKLLSSQVWIPSHWVKKSDSALKGMVKWWYLKKFFVIISSGDDKLRMVDAYDDLYMNQFYF